MREGMEGMGGLIFANWSMGYVGETKTNRALFMRFSAADHFKPQEMTRENALQLLLALAEDLKMKSLLAIA